jgi:hypothetical protein
MTPHRPVPPHRLGRHPLLWLLVFVPAVFVGQALEPEAHTRPA